MKESNPVNLKNFQQSWANHKYWVMSRSQQSYNEIRLLAKGNEWNSQKQEEYERILGELEEVQPTKKTLRVAYEHVWGYFKKIASQDEKDKYKELLSQIDVRDKGMLLFLYELAQRYNQAYLLEMRWDFL